MPQETEIFKPNTDETIKMEVPHLGRLNKYQLLNLPHVSTILRRSQST